jgi:hypothetical protein
MSDTMNDTEAARKESRALILGGLGSLVGVTLFWFFGLAPLSDMMREAVFILCFIFPLLYAILAVLGAFAGRMAFRKASKWWPAFMAGLVAGFVATAVMFGLFFLMEYLS